MKSLERVPFVIYSKGADSVTYQEMEKQVARIIRKEASNTVIVSMVPLMEYCTFVLKRATIPLVLRQSSCMPRITNCYFLPTKQKNFPDGTKLYHRTRGPFFGSVIHLRRLYGHRK